MKVALSIRIAAFVLLATTSVFSQSKERTLRWAEIPISNRNTVTAVAGSQVLAQIESLEIKDISVAGKSITMGQPFAADDNWVTSLTLRVKNISQQNFKSIQINMFLPEIMPGGPLVSFFYKSGDESTGRSTMPGDEFEMKVAFPQWVTDQIKSKSNPSLITKAEIHDVTVMQSDGKRLLSGCIRTADQKSACPIPAP
jgi:hypothetical protein